MRREFTGYTVVVTGGTQGIGLAVSRAFHEGGAHVVVVGRHSPVSSECFGDFVNADLETEEGCCRVAEHITQKGGSVDVLVNNAGVAHFLPLEESTDNLLMQQLMLNLAAPYRLTRSLLPQLKQAGGCVINMSSYFSDRMLKNRPSSVYSMTKGGLESLTKALAFELGEEGVRVNAIAPGTVDTPLFRRNLNALSQEARTEFFRAIGALYPLGRLGQPEDVARVALFLASRDAGWVTGTVLPVDGGLTTH